jgi:hypothetical protein
MIIENDENQNSGQVSGNEKKDSNVNSSFEIAFSPTESNLSIATNNSGEEFKNKLPKKTETEFLQIGENPESTNQAIKNSNLDNIFKTVLPSSETNDYSLINPEGGFGQNQKPNSSFEIANNNNARSSLSGYYKEEDLENSNFNFPLNIKSENFETDFSKVRSNSLKSNPNSPWLFERGQNDKNLILVTSKNNNKFKIYNAFFDNNEPGETQAKLKNDFIATLLKCAKDSKVNFSKDEILAAYDRAKNHSWVAKTHEQNRFGALVQQEFEKFKIYTPSADKESKCPARLMHVPEEVLEILMNDKSIGSDLKNSKLANDNSAERNKSYVQKLSGLNSASNVFSKNI